MERFGDKVLCNPTVKLSKGCSYPFISIDKIVPGYKNVESDEQIEYDGQSSSKFEEHDVLMARITPCLENGKIAIAKTDGSKGFGSTEFFVFRGIEGVTNTDYIYYLLCMPYMRKLAANSMTGASGRQRADLGFIKRIPWEYPSLEKQERIVEILSTYDRLIQNNSKRISQLERMEESLYKEWFVRFRFPGHENTELIDGLPNNWKRMRISECYITSSGGTPSRGNTDYYEGGNIPWIKTGEMQDCLIIKTEECITEEAVKKSSAKHITADSVLMAMYGVNIGKLAYTTMDATCNQACCVFKEKYYKSSKHYLFQYLKSIREYLLLIGFGAAQQNLSQDLIKKVKMVVPDKETVCRFEQAIEPFYQEKKMLLLKSNSLIEQRNRLLPKLMTGSINL